jgi:hypothetical protein
MQVRLRKQERTAQDALHALPTVRDGPPIVIVDVGVEGVVAADDGDGPLPELPATSAPAVATPAANAPDHHPLDWSVQKALSALDEVAGAVPFFGSAI